MHPLRTVATFGLLPVPPLPPAIGDPCSPREREADKAQREGDRRVETCDPAAAQASPRAGPERTG
jgi:hypothetical protein